MPSVSPLSTGLFETHVQRARAFLAEGKADLAEQDLAEAYLLKPRDLTVLSLLGVLYFKQVVEVSCNGGWSEKSKTPAE